MTSRLSQARRATALLIAFGACAAHAAPVTYAFTGTVSGTSGGYASIALGTAVSGTFTLDLSNANASQSSPSVSLTASWTEQAYGGAIYGLPVPPAAYVVSSAATFGSDAYQTNPVPGAYQTSTSVATGALATGLSNGYYSATERVCPTSAACSSSQLLIESAAANPWTAAGLPVFASGATGNGYFSVPGASISYNLVSLTQLQSGRAADAAQGDGPLPPWALLALGGGLLLLGRRRIRDGG